MTIRNQTIDVNRGDSYLLFVSLTQADGTPFDPTAGVEMKWRMCPTSHATPEETLVLKEINSGIELVESGVEISIDIADTNFIPGLYYHELKVWDGGDASTAMTGPFIIRRVLNQAP